ncbi:MAG: hypothetical protein JSV90_03825 [Methanobacteriota archaeon]|nr:MAG: hypothetical protein JSV90_03825 [Euryarchaeota archaeon]
MESLFDDERASAVRDLERMDADGLDSEDKAKYLVDLIRAGTYSPMRENIKPARSARPSLGPELEYSR